METKTYRAPNMLAALQEIQRDLGPDALVISMREITTGPAWQVWNKPGVEVVAARGNQGVSTKSKAKTTSETEQPIPGRKEIEAILEAIAARKGFNPQTIREDNLPTETKTTTLPKGNGEPTRWAPPVIERTEGDKNAALASENTAVRNLGGIVDHIISTHQPKNTGRLKMPEVPAGMQEMERILLRQGLDSESIAHLITTNLETLSPTVLNDGYRLRKYLMKQMAASLRPQKNSMAVIQSRIMCILGTSGSGKTSTCAKLAAFYTHKLAKKVVWICADTVRAGAIPETKTYTDVIQVPVFFAYTPQELGEIVRDQQDADLIIIDTPGVNMLDETKVAEVGSFLNEVPGRSVYLTAPATTKLSDLEQEVLTFQLFKIKGLIITKMDETYSYGEIYKLLQKTRLPVHFFTDGTQVIGHLHPGDPDLLVAAMFGERSIE